MCGILLAYSDRPIDRARFDLARDTLIHRGPDAQQSVFLDEDRLALGHTRLAIIDLSSSGNQPMQSEELWVTFNGEIYNYPDLRKELEGLGCRFRTNSDTEVLLHGYRMWGERLCERLLGMFAFAIWDDRNRQLFLGRDHFGQKPLYLAEIDGAFVAASEIKAIRAFARTTFTLRKESIVDAMVQDFVAEPNTWFREITCIPAGHCLTVRRNGAGTLVRNLREYWTFRPDPNPRPITEAEALERLEAELDRAVRSHLLADVEVGAFLSGGIDSTCVTTLASQMVSTPIQTFSIGFGGNDELPLARETAARIGARHHEGIVTEADYRASRDRALELFDYPFADTSLVPTERVSQLAAQHVKVVLTGDGGDETFGGYDYGRYIAPQLGPSVSFGFSPRAVRDTIGSLRSRAAWKILGQERWSRSAREFLVDRRRLTPRLRSMLATPLLNDVSGYDPADAWKAHRDLALDPVRDAQWVGIKVPLASKMLVKVDRCSMAHSLETRAPFLSPRLAEFMLDLPTAITNPGANWYKGLLRCWLRGRISDNVMQAKKRGFSLPTGWSAVSPTPGARGPKMLKSCVGAALISLEGAQRLAERPHLLWFFSQIDTALDQGAIRA
jgi:asparagine synthase (glutamine-hydrolysing)